MTDAKGFARGHTDDDRHFSVVAWLWDYPTSLNVTGPGARFGESVRVESAGKVGWRVLAADAKGFARGYK